MSHLEEGLLHALLDGEIPSDELPPLQAHLESCPECRTRLEQERRLLADADGLVEILEVPAGAPARAPASAPRVRPQWGRRLAWAASLLAAVGLGYVARGAGRTQLVTNDVTPAERGADSGVSPVAAPAPEPMQGPVAAVSAPPRRSANAARVPRRESAATALAQQEEKRAAERTEASVATGKVLLDSTAAAVRQAKAAAPAAADRAVTPELGRLRAGSEGFARLSPAPPATLAPPEPVTLPDAVRRLGGSLRLVDGLVPLRLEAQGQTIRVVYALVQGELLLSQQLIDGRVVFQLIAPPGFPADSLGRLRARVRE